MKFIVSEWQTTTQANRSLYKSLMASNPHQNLIAQLTLPMHHTALFAKSFSLMAIIFELLAGIAIFFYPKRLLSHFIFIGMIGGIFFFRLETGFLALLATMGLLLSPSKKISIVYLIIILVFSVLMATGLGLR